MTTPSTSAQGPVALDAVIAAIEDQMPATQDMESTSICDALDRAIVAVRALPASPSPASDASPSGVRVKPLVWTGPLNGSGPWSAKALGLQYVVCDRQWWEENSPTSVCESNEAAKAAAQADYEARILSALASATPAPTSGGEDGGSRKLTPKQRVWAELDRRAALAKPASEPAGGDDLVSWIENLPREPTPALRAAYEAYKSSGVDAALSSSAAPAGEAGFAYRDENGDIAYQDAHPAPATVEMRELADAAQEWCDAVDRNPSWDGWDHHFKNVKWNILPRVRAALSATATEGRKS